MGTGFTLEAARKDRERHARKATEREQERKRLQAEYDRLKRGEVLRFDYPELPDFSGDSCVESWGDYYWYESLWMEDLQDWERRVRRDQRSDRPLGLELTHYRGGFQVAIARKG